MNNKEAQARIKINKLLEQAGWRFEDSEIGKANISLEPGVDIADAGDDFENIPKGYIDYLLLDKDGRPLVVLEAKKESIEPLSAKEQARNYARNVGARFVILVQVGSEQILAEIKGDNASYPGTGHIAQLWKHLKNKKEIERGALILNYDVSTEPEKRKFAYTGEEEHQIADIIYIDTRALHDLAIAIIDYGMKPEDATKILFQNGRVTFNLEKHKEEFEAKQTATVNGTTNTK